MKIPVTENETRTKQVEAVYETEKVQDIMTKEIEKTN